MALTKASIQADILKAFNNVMNDEGDPEKSLEANRKAALDKLSGALADAVIDAVLSLDIVYTAGLLDATSGPVTGTFEYTLK